MRNLGAMRHQVTIERQSTEQQPSGQRVDEWILVARRRAERVENPGREFFAAQQQAARVPTIFKLRHLEGVLPAMRLTCAGKVYDIVSAIDPDNGRKLELVITAEERVGETP